MQYVRRLSLGFLLFKEFCSTLCDEPVPQLKFYEEVKQRRSIRSSIFASFPFVFQIKRFEKLETDEERWRVGKEIYDQFIMKELLSNSHVKHHDSSLHPSHSSRLSADLFRTCRGKCEETSVEIQPEQSEKHSPIDPIRTV